jgi:NADH dehydrogenase
MGRPRVVIVGAGFAGLFAAKSLARAAADVIVVDRHNYHLFQPLLYQVAVAGLPPSDIAWPIRSILRRQANATVLLGEVTAIARSERTISMRGATICFDYLVIAASSTHSYFGHPEWQSPAPGLKSIDDATLIRRRILTAFEHAEVATDPRQREHLLTFVIIGGGATGVELAGTIAELAQRTLAKDFRNIDPREAKICLVEAGDRILSGLHGSLSAYAESALVRLGVAVHLNTRVAHCDSTGVEFATGERLSSATVLWAAGVEASPLIKQLDIETDRSGRAVVGSDLSVPKSAEIFVVGDAAAVIDAEGAAVPGVAPAAKQQGRYVRRLIAARISKRKSVAPFRYRHVGHLATIGRQSAVIEFPFMRLRGWFAWWIWGVAHIHFLIGVPSPLFVSVRWLWEYLTYGRGARLITGSEDAD